MIHREDGVVRVPFELDLVPESFGLCGHNHGHGGDEVGLVTCEI